MLYDWVSNQKLDEQSVCSRFAWRYSLSQYKRTLACLAFTIYLYLRECTTNSKSCCTISIYRTSFAWTFTWCKASAVHSIVWFGSTLAREKKQKFFRCKFFYLYLISSILVWESNYAEQWKHFWKKNDTISSDYWLYTEYKVYVLLTQIILFFDRDFTSWS